MKKRIYVEFEELYQAYIDCCKHKRSSKEYIEFDMDMSENLVKLYTELNKMSYVIGKSKVFCVDKPVKREIFAAHFRDRIVHHLLINRLMDIFENEFIDNSFSCRVGKGVSKGVEQCRDDIKSATNNYTNVNKVVIKCDLKAFFMTIDKRNLYDVISNLVKEKYVEKQDGDLDFVLWLLKLIIFNSPQSNCIFKQPKSKWKDLPKDKSLFYCDGFHGVPIGNLTSQIFANIYLSRFDKFVTKALSIKYYGRYVDDFYIIIDPNDIKPSELVNTLRDKLNEIGVTLHPKKLYIQPVSKGVKFIGAVIKLNRVYVGKRTLGNFYNTLTKLSENLPINEEPTYEFLSHMTTSINSYLGFMVHYKSFKLRKKILSKPQFSNIFKYCYIDKNYTKVTLFQDYMEVVTRKRHLYQFEYENDLY